MPAKKLKPKKRKRRKKGDAKGQRALDAARPWHHPPEVLAKIPDRPRFQTPLDDSNHCRRCGLVLWLDSFTRDARERGPIERGKCRPCRDPAYAREMNRQWEPPDIGRFVVSDHNGKLAVYLRLPKKLSEDLADALRLELVADGEALSDAD